MLLLFMNFNLKRNEIAKFLNEKMFVFTGNSPFQDSMNL